MSADVGVLYFTRSACGTADYGAACRCERSPFPILRFAISTATPTREKDRAGDKSSPPAPSFANNTEVVNIQIYAPVSVQLFRAAGDCLVPNFCGGGARRPRKIQTVGTAIGIYADGCQTFRPPTCGQVVTVSGTRLGPSGRLGAVGMGGPAPQSRSRIRICLPGTGFRWATVSKPADLPKSSDRSKRFQLPHH